MEGSSKPSLLLRSQTQLAQHLQEQARTPLALNTNKDTSTICYVDFPQLTTSSLLLTQAAHTATSKSFPAAQHPQAQTPGGLPGFSPAFLTPKPRLCAVQEQEAEEVAAPAAYLCAGSKHAGVSAAADDDEKGLITILPHHIC